VIFLNEWTTEIQYGDRMDLVRLMDRVKRERRVVVDLDGKYNDAVKVVGDYNHPDEATSRKWVRSATASRINLSGDASSSAA